jgi:hypothetical protein
VTNITAGRDLKHRRGVGVRGISIFIDEGEPEPMTERKKREKVVAEITVSHLTQVAGELGRPLTAEDAIAFLNQQGRAYEMWKHMMHAAEDYIKSALQSRSPVLMPRQHGVRDRMAV